jgi:hypothetical protein
MSKEECMEALSKHANIKPVITSTGLFLFTLSSCFPSRIYTHHHKLTNNTHKREREREREKAVKRTSLISRVVNA